MIERYFGLLKEQFPLVKATGRYLCTRPPSIVTACGAIHNFLQIHQPSNDLFMHYSGNEYTMKGEGNFRHDFTELNVTLAAKAMGHESDAMADMMWNASR